MYTTDKEIKITVSPLPNHHIGRHRREVGAKFHTF
jgi:hypothetical protein